MNTLREVFLPLKHENAEFHKKTMYGIHCFVDFSVSVLLWHFDFHEF
jgi:hypothetical protein